MMCATVDVFNFYCFSIFLQGIQIVIYKIFIRLKSSWHIGRMKLTATKHIWHFFLLFSFYSPKLSPGYVGTSPIFSVADFSGG